MMTMLQETYAACGGERGDGNPALEEDLWACLPLLLQAEQCLLFWEQ